MKFVTRERRLKDKLVDEMAHRDKVRAIYNYLHHVKETRASSPEVEDFIDNEILIVSPRLKETEDKVKETCKELGHRFVTGGSAIHHSPDGEGFYCLVCGHEGELP